MNTTIHQMVTTLVPTLSRSLAEQFNVFRVMHHGTHEKQLSNVFAWLLRENGTHGLGDAFQRIFVGHVNRSLSTESQLPPSGYRVLQEVNTSDHDALSRDIADIVLTGERASLVVENFESSDGHGHDYKRYLAYGAMGGRRSVVVLLCARRESQRLTDGWEQAVVVTYAELLEGVQAHIADDVVWQRTHPRQHVFIRELVEHLVEGVGAVSDEGRIAFIRTMCETGESARYGYRPQESAALEFADLLAQHAKRQFVEGRETLAEVKRGLKRFAERTLVGQVNEVLHDGPIVTVKTRFQGQWEWCVELQRSDMEPSVFLEFGPTAVVENGRASQPLVDPDYAKVFVTRQAADTPAVDDEVGGIDRIIQTEVGIDEIIDGLSGDDARLRDSVLALVSAR